MWCALACVHAWRDTATLHGQEKGSLLSDHCTSLSVGVTSDWGGDGLFSFNSKLAVLVSEPDVQIKKVRHAHLILVNLPLHISPACQLLCDSNHHRHMPLLCAAPPPHTPLLCKAVVFLFCKTDNFTSLWIAIDKSKTVSSFQNVTTGWRWTLELFVYILEEC